MSKQNARKAFFFRRFVINIKRYGIQRFFFFNYILLRRKHQSMWTYFDAMGFWRRLYWTTGIWNHCLKKNYFLWLTNTNIFTKEYIFVTEWLILCMSMIWVVVSRSILAQQPTSSIFTSPWKPQILHNHEYDYRFRSTKYFT